MLQEGHRLKAWGFLDTGTGAELLQAGKPRLASSRTYGEAVPMLKLNPCIQDDRHLKTPSSTPKTPAEAEVGGLQSRWETLGMGGVSWSMAPHKRRGELRNKEDEEGSHRKGQLCKPCDTS